MKLPPGFWLTVSRFWSVVTFKYTIVVIACSLATWIHLAYRIPGVWLSVMLPVIGVALGALSCILLIEHLLIRVPQDDPFRLALGRIQWWAGLLIRIYVYGSLLIYANGVLDRSKPVYLPADTVAITYGMDADVPVVPYGWITVQDPQNPARTKRISLRQSERSDLWGAAPVVLTTRDGYFGVPWVEKIERDKDRYAREILKLTPTAANAWKELISFDLTHDRWNEAFHAAREYLKLYPNDYREAVLVGGAFDQADRFEEAIHFYDYAAARHPTYANYQRLGTALSYGGQKARAAEVLEISIPLNPDYWEAYYHLGYVYADLGRAKEAVAMFEKVLERNPDFPEVETEIAKLKEAIAAQQRRKSKGHKE